MHLGVTEGPTEWSRGKVSKLVFYAQSTGPGAKTLFSTNMLLKKKKKKKKKCPQTAQLQFCMLLSSQKLPFRSSNGEILSTDRKNDVG